MSLPILYNRYSQLTNLTENNKRFSFLFLLYCKLLSESINGKLRSTTWKCSFVDLWSQSFVIMDVSLHNVFMHVKKRYKCTLFLYKLMRRLDPLGIRDPSNIMLACFGGFSTLLYEMPSISKGKNFVWKIYCFFPLNLRVLPATDSDGSTCRFWWKYLQKVIAKRPQISDEK